MTAKKTTDEDILSVGSRDEGEALPKDPSLLEDTTSEPVPEVTPPNQTVPEGKVEVETPDVTVQRKANAKRATPTKANDPLRHIDDHEKLPVTVSVGDVVLSVQSRFGNAIVSFSLKGWVGEPEFQIPVEQIAEYVEPAIAELRKALGA